MHVCTKCAHQRWFHGRWYITGDDDSIMMVTNQLTYLGGLSPQKPLYMGGHTNERLQIAHWERHGKPMEVDDVPIDGFAYGGGGVVLSAAIMKQLAPTFEACLLEMREVCRVHGAGSGCGCLVVEWYQKTV